MQNNALEILSRIPTKEYIEPWPQPILFENTLLPSIQAAWLPESLSAFAKALAVATETDESMSVMTILGVVSTCLSKYVVISPKPGWLEPINIYTLIALPPANHKSLIIRTCCSPLIEWEKHQRTIIEPSAKRRHAEIETEKRILQQMRIQAGKCTDPNDQRRLMQEITEREVSMPNAITIPKLFANDCTPESLATHTAEQAGRFAIISDEGGIFDTLGGLYNHGVANVDIVLKGIDGGQVRLARKSGTYDIEPYLTFVLCIQPQVIQNMAAKNAFVGKGFLERFLYVIPKSQLGFRSHNTPGVDDALQHSYNAHIAQLLASAESLACQEQPEVFKLSPEAKTLWHEFQQNTEKQLQPQGELSTCLGWGGKISGFTLRIAGLLEAARSNLLDKVISGNTMNNAIHIATALKQHALAAFNLMSADGVMQDANVLFQLIQHKGLSRFTKTEINRMVKQRKLGKSERLTRALMELIERQIIRAYMDNSTQRPTEVFMLNPAVLTEPA